MSVGGLTKLAIIKVCFIVAISVRNYNRARTVCEVHQRYPGIYSLRPTLILVPTELSPPVAVWGTAATELDLRDLRHRPPVLDSHRLDHLAIEYLVLLVQYKITKRLQQSIELSLVLYYT